MLFDKITDARERKEERLRKQAPPPLTEQEQKTLEYNANLLLQRDVRRRIKALDQSIVDKNVQRKR